MQSRMGGLAMRAYRAGEVLVVLGRGAMTAQSLQDMRVYAMLEFQRQDARALVFDVSRMLYRVDCVDELVASACRGPRPTAPGAYVVSELAYEPVRKVCWHLAELGVIRGVFRDRARACAWAADRREHWSHPPALAAAAG